MKKALAAMPLLTILLATACDEGAVAPLGEEGGITEIVVTQGVVAPIARPYPFIPLKSDLAASTVVGSETTPVTLEAQDCEDASQTITVTYTITGRQVNSASFKVYTKWSYDGTTWTGSVPTTVTVPSRAASDAATIRTVDITVENASGTATGTSSFAIVPFDVSTTPPAALGIVNGNVAVHAAFEGCAVANSAPTLVLPNDLTLEASSAAGAVAIFLVTATDVEDGVLTATCTHESGDTFPLGTTTVECSVTDNGGLTTTGSFTITIEDTTPPGFPTFPGNEIRIAQNIDGWAFDLSSFDILAEDAGGVSEPSTFACDVVDGTMLAIGATHPVSCTATDAIGNEGAPQIFQVFVTLDLAGVGFLAPLREESPYSAHKLGSTVPHKFPAPRYADGTPATELASGLRLVLTRVGGGGTYDTMQEDDYSAGSTAWRWDQESQHYIFNLKTPKSGWSTGTYATEASFAGIPLASTFLELRK